MADVMKWEILVDGTIKITTDEISPANHITADDLLAEVGRLSGGAVTREQRGDRHDHEQHTHTHGSVRHKH